MSTIKKTIKLFFTIFFMWCLTNTFHAGLVLGTTNDHDVNIFRTIAQCCAQFSPTPTNTANDAFSLAVGYASASDQINVIDWSINLYGSVYFAVGTGSVVGAGGSTGQILIYELRTNVLYPGLGLRLASTTNMGGTIDILRFHPTLPILAVGLEGASLASGNQVAQLYLFDVSNPNAPQQTYSQLFTSSISVSKNDAEALAWDPTGQYLAVHIDANSDSASQAANLRVFRLNTSTITLSQIAASTISGRSPQTNSCCWDSTSTYIAVGYETSSPATAVQIFKFFDPYSSLQLAGSLTQTQTPGGVFSLEFSPTDFLLMVAFGSSPYFSIYEYTPNISNPPASTLTLRLSNIINNSASGPGTGLDATTYSCQWHDNTSTCILLSSGATTAPQTRIYSYNQTTQTMFETGQGIRAITGNARACRWSRNLNYVAYSNENVVFVWAVTDAACGDLRVVKTVDNQTPFTLQTITFTVTVLNTGPTDMSNVIVTDLLPAGLTFLSSSTTQGTYTSGTGIWNVGRVAVNTTKTLTINAQVNAGTGGTTITNTATVTENDPYNIDPYPGNNSSSVTLTILNPADLVITKNVNSSSPREGNLVVYTIVVTNRGSSGINNVTVTDVLPAGVTFQTSSATQGSYNVATGIWTIGFVAANTTKTLTITVLVNNGTGGQTIINTATLNENDPYVSDPYLNNNTANARFTVARQADLAITKTVNSSNVREGDVIAYTITVTNRGTNAINNVSVSDVLPSGVTFQTSNATQGSYNASTGIWTIGAMAVNDVQTLTITVLVNNGTGGQTITNTATIFSSDPYVFDPYGGDNSASARFMVARQADLAITKTVNNSSVREGDVIAYTVTVTNRGANAINNVSVADVLPAGVTFQTSSATQGSYNFTTGIWTIGLMNANTIQTLTITVLVNNGTGGQTITNTATVFSSDPYVFDPYDGDNSSSVTITVARQADLAITKTVNNSSVREGDVIAYTVTVTNRGPNAINNVSVTDVLPSGVTFQSSNATQGSYNAGTGIWTIGLMPANTVQTLTITVLVNNGTGGQTITNTATVFSSDPYVFDPYGGDNSASVTITVARQADLAITKTVNNSSVREGDVIAYTVTVTNRGTNAINNVSVTDVLPAGVTFQSSNATQGSYNAGTGIWTIGLMPANAVQTLTITVLVNNGTGGQTITNTATVFSSDPYVFDPYGGDNSSSATITVARQADLAITKTVNNSSVREGDVIAYTVTVTNRGTNAINNVSVTDVLPSGVTFQSSNATQGSYNAGTGIWTIGAMAVNAVQTLTITVLVNNGTGGQTITNTATVFSSDPYVFDPYGGDNSSSVTITVARQADLAITKTVNNSSVREGDAIAYTVTVTNRGTNAINNVSVTDVLPSGVTFQSSNATQGSYNAGTGIWTIGAMAVNAVQTLTITVLVNNGTGGQTITNTATVFSSDPYVFDPYGGDNSSSVTITVARQADLAITKTVNNSSVREGDAIAYTVTVTNRGTNAINNVSVTDVLPSGVTFQTSNATQGSYNAGTGIWTIGTMAVNAVQTLTITVLVNNGTGGQTITNTATVFSSDPYVFDPYGGDNSSSVTITVARQADLAITKTVNNSSVREGDVIAYTVTVTNRGTNAINNVSVTDILPSGVTFQTSNATQGSYNAGTGIWTIGFMPANTVQTLTITVLVNNGTGGQTITNTATVFSSDPYVFDPYGGDNSASATITVARQADLAITKTVNNSSVREGDVIAYTVTVTNRGTNAINNVSVTDVLPSGVTFQSSNATQGSYNAGTGIWTIGTIAVNAVQTLTITVLVNNGTGGQTITNTATVFSSDPYVFDPYGGDNSSSVTITVARQADLAITKTVNNSSVREGDVIAYTVTVTNRGTNAINNVSVTDVLPSGVTFQTSNATQGSYNAGTGIWTIGFMPANTVQTLTITVLVNNGTGGQTITNTATVFSSDPYVFDPYGGDNSSSVTITVARQADLAITKTVNNSSVREGDVIAYTVTVTNRGTNAINNVSVTDVLPSGVTFQSSNATQGSYNAGTGIWTIGFMSANTVQTLTITVLVNNGTGGQTITNTATVFSSDPYVFDPYGGDNSSSVSITVARQADLAITKTVNNSNVREGDVIAYTMTVTNRGTNAINNVSVTDVLPSGVTFQTSNATQGSYNAGTGLWTIGAMAVNAVQTLTITVLVNNGTGGQTITNTATVFSSDPYVFDPYGGDNSASATITVARQADLAITKTVNNSSVREGDVIAYTVTVTNRGTNAINNVSVTDVLPSGVTFQSSNATQGSYNAGTGLWTIGAMAVNAVQTLTITVLVNNGTGGQTITNTATVFSSDPYVFDPYGGDNSASATITVARQADLAITKTVNNSSVREGDVIAYTVTVTNRGTNAINNVSVTDVLPAGVTFQTSNATQGSYNAGTGIWTIGTMAVNAVQTLTITVLVNNGTGGQTITNTATVFSSDPYVFDPYGGDNSSSVTITVARQADLAITKTVNNSSVREGDVIAYTVTVTNRGTNAINNVSVTDVLPSGVTFQSSNATQGSYNAGTGIWAIGLMSANTIQTLTITVLVNNGTGGQTIVNTATINENDPYVFDPYSGNNNSSSAQITVARQADLVISKTANTNTAQEDTTIVYTIIVTNRGPNVMNNVSVTDILPSEVTFQSSSATQGSYNSGTGIWDIGTMNANSVQTLTITVTINAGTVGQTITNTATINENDPYVFDPYGSNNNSSSTLVRVINTADLRVTKTASDTAPQEGQSIIYTITVTNTGPFGVNNVQVADILPTGVTYQSSSATQGSYNVGTGIWTIGYMPANTVQTLNITVTIDSMTAGLIIINTAILTENDPYVFDPYNSGGNNRSSAPIMVQFNTYTGANFIHPGSILFWDIEALSQGTCNTIAS